MFGTIQTGIQTFSKFRVIIKKISIQETRNKLEIIYFHARKDRSRYFKLSFDYIPVIAGQKFAKSVLRRESVIVQTDGRGLRVAKLMAASSEKRSKIPEKLERGNCERERYGSTALNFPDRRYVFIPAELGALKSEIYIPSVVKVSWTIKKSKWESWKEKTPNETCTCTREGTELFGIFDPCVIRR